MFGGFSGRPFHRSHVVLSALIVLFTLQPLVARADQCDDAWAAFQGMSPEKRAALARSTTFSFGDVEEQQKAQCESDKGFIDLQRLTLSGARQVTQACGSRIKLACNVACQEKSLSDLQQKATHDCDPATLEEVKRADQAQRAQQDAEFKAQQAVDNACIAVAAAGSFPDLPHDSAYSNNVRLCNANPKECKSVRESLSGSSKWPSDLTCGGSSDGVVGNTDTSSHQRGNWLVIMGAWPAADSAKVKARMALLSSNGITAQVIKTDDYPNLSPGLRAVVLGPVSKNEAQAQLQSVMSVVPDAFIKEGMK